MGPVVRCDDGIPAKAYRAADNTSLWTPKIPVENPSLNFVHRRRVIPWLLLRTPDVMPEIFSIFFVRRHSSS